MERDCETAHGAAQTLACNMNQLSDGTEMILCNTCGNLGYFNHKKQTLHCSFCPRQTESLVKITIPAAFVVLMWELAAMGISVGMKVDEKANANTSVPSGPTTPTHMQVPAKARSFGRDSKNKQTSGPSLFVQRRHGMSEE